MRQSRLDNYFNIPARRPPRPGLSFLDLPPSARRLVYQYLGLTDQTIDLNFSNLLIYPQNEYPDTTWAVRSRCHHSCASVNRLSDHAIQFREAEVWEADEDDDCPWTYSCDCYSGYAMLFVSKQISEEVLPLVYSANSFSVRQGCPNGFRRLHQMSEQGIGALTSLTLKLDIKDERSWCDEDYSFDQTLPCALDFRHKNSCASIQEYKEIIGRLSQLVRPHRLSLYLIFHVRDSESLQALLEPLFQLPTLRSCGIWAFPGLKGPKWAGQAKPGFDDLTPLRIPSSSENSEARIDEMEHLVSSALHRLTDPLCGYEGAFHYSKLPTELRLNILQYTDLVSPHDLQWRPRMASPEWQQIRRSQCSCIRDHGFGLFERTGGCICEEARHSIWKRGHYEVEGCGWLSRGPSSCCFECRPSGATRMCFCSCKGRIYSTTCVCRKLRHPLFSVSRQVREDAIATYYSRNRFVVVPFRSASELERRWPIQGIGNMASVELSLYISSVTRNALQYIRWLEWVLPTSKASYLRPRTPGWFDYLDTLDMMRHAMNTQNLTFVLNMAAQGSQDGEHEYYDGDYIPDLVSPTAWKWYEQIALALHRLGPLKDCFIYLSYSTRRVRERVLREQSLERSIMGPQYDSQKRGKPMERLTAFWKREYGQYGPYLI